MLGKNGRYYTDKVVNCGEAPCYRDVSITMRLADEQGEREVTLQLSPDDAIKVMQHIRSVNELAWREGRPLDARDGEHRPDWL